MRGNADPTFMERINGIVLCLTAACLYHALKAWSTGTFVQPPDFTMATAGGEFGIHNFEGGGIDSDCRHLPAPVGHLGTVTRGCVHEDCQGHQKGYKKA